MPHLKNGQTLAPEILPERSPVAEVLVGPQSLTVTVCIPQLEDKDFDVTLTRHSVRIRGKKDAASVNYIIPLPVTVEPERYVLRHSTGVFDFVVARASH